MKLKLNYKLFGWLYLVILAGYVFQIFVFGQADSTTNMVTLLIFGSLITFCKACGVILIAYIIFRVIKENNV